MDSRPQGLTDEQYIAHLEHALRKLAKYAGVATDGEEFWIDESRRSEPQMVDISIIVATADVVLVDWAETMV